MVSMMSERVVTVQGLAKHFAKFTAVHELDLHLDRGEVVGFLGPNGAGKSTTMKIITGYLAASSGSIDLLGHDPHKEPLACRRLIGYLPQELPLYREMTVRSYLDHVARLKGIPAGERRHECVKAMERANLQEVEKRHIHKLSGGNRQRVGLAQALIGKPPLLVLDEATAGLDPAQVANFRELIRSLASDHTILLSTHIMAEVETCCSRVVMINRGRRLLDESIDALRERAAQRQRVLLHLRDGDQLDACAAALAADPGITTVEREGRGLLLDHDAESRGSVVRIAEAHGGVATLTEERLSLEEVFRELVR
jgi:ABC-2 type transport system ATP-binding protein